MWETMCIECGDMFANDGVTLHIYIYRSAKCWTSHVHCPHLQRAVPFVIAAMFSHTFAVGNVLVPVGSVCELIANDTTCARCRRHPEDVRWRRRCQDPCHARSCPVQRHCPAVVSPQCLFGDAMFRHNAYSSGGASNRV